MNKPEMFPLPVALALLRSAYSSESYGPINRRIIEGVRVGGLKS